jgi:hypothetical protein
MCRRVSHCGWAGLLALVLAAGCNRGAEPTGNANPDDEAQVRAVFAELQAALKAEDADKVWDLLDGKSRADAEREAGKVRAAYAQAGPEEKARREAALGLSGPDLSGLTGKGVLKSKPFRGKYHEVPDSTVEKVTLEKDSATVHYHEPDDEHDKLILVREDGRWKVWLTIPRISQVPAAPSGGDRPQDTASDEAAVRVTVADLQKALKDRDADKVWGLLDAGSQGEAEKKKALEAKLGLDAAGVAGLNGRGYLKTKVFLARYNELAESKVTGVTVKDREATVDYVEPDEDRKKLKLVKADSKWKVPLTIPAVPQGR